MFLVRKNPTVKNILDRTVLTPEDNNPNAQVQPPTTSIEDVDNELVQDWMSHDPITIESCASLYDAYWLMDEHSIRRLPVMEDGLLVGNITLNDLRSYSPPLAIIESAVLLSETLSEGSVLQLMTSHPKTIEPTARLLEAACMMLDNRISALPFVAEEQVICPIEYAQRMKLVSDMPIDSWLF
jgi:CBS domain-containing protein